MNIIAELNIAHAELFIMMHTVITFKLARLNARQRPPTTCWVVYRLTSLLGSVEWFVWRKDSKDHPAIGNERGDIEIKITSSYLADRRTAYLLARWFWTLRWQITVSGDHPLHPTGEQIWILYSIVSLLLAPMMKEKKDIFLLCSVYLLPKSYFWRVLSFHWIALYFRPCFAFCITSIPLPRTLPSALCLSGTCCAFFSFTAFLLILQ